jgi:hypothetical protein
MRVSRFVGVVCVVAGGFALLLAAAPVRAADPPRSDGQPCIQWDVKPGIEVNRSRAERLYKSSHQWVQANFFVDGMPEEPCVTIKVGERCPDYSANNCVNFVKQVIYLKAWDDRAAVLLAESFLLMSIYDKFVHGGGANVAIKIASDDLKQFVDISELRKK